MKGCPTNRQFVHRVSSLFSWRLWFGAGWMLLEATRQKKDEVVVWCERFWDSVVCCRNLTHAILDAFLKERRRKDRKAPDERCFASWCSGSSWVKQVPEQAHVEREDPTGQQAQGLEALAQPSSTKGAKPHFHNPLVLGSGCPPAHDWSGCTATSTRSSAANFAKCWTNAFRRCLKRVASDGQSGIRIWTSAIHGMSGHTVGVTVWGGAASTVRLRADTDSKLASDIKFKVRGAQRASSPPILDVTNQTSSVSRCLLPQPRKQHRVWHSLWKRIWHKSSQCSSARQPFCSPSARCASPMANLASSVFSPELSDVFLPNHFPPFHVGAPFSYDELVAAFSKCYESAPGADGLPYSVFKERLLWWRHFLLSFLNVHSALDHRSFGLEIKHCARTSNETETPVLKTPIVRCASPLVRSKVFEHLIHTRIVGVFRCSADVMFYGVLDPFRLRRHTHTFAAFVDVGNAFEPFWVEAPMGRWCFWSRVAHDCVFLLRDAVSGSRYFLLRALGRLGHHTRPTLSFAQRSDCSFSCDFPTKRRSWCPFVAVRCLLTCWSALRRRCGSLGWIARWIASRSRWVSRLELSLASLSSICSAFEWDAGEDDRPFVSDCNLCVQKLESHEWNYMSLLWNIVRVLSTVNTLQLSSQHRLCVLFDSWWLNPLSTTSFPTLKLWFLIIWPIWSFTAVFNCW